MTNSPLHNPHRWHDIMAAIEQHQTFVITSHINPDCDALGSEIGLAEHLRMLDKTVRIINSDPIPADYRFLDAAPPQLIETFDAAHHAAYIAQADAIIVVDASGTWERTGAVGDLLRQSPAQKLCIDHHPDGADIFNLAVIDTDVAAATELIYSLIETSQGQITPKMAQALYTGLVTDTGSFRFPKTSRHTHYVAGILLDCGVEPYEIYRQLYEQTSLPQIQLQGHLMSRMQTASQGQVIYYQLSQADLTAYQLTADDLKGFSNLGQQVKGVRVSIFGVETKDHHVKLSLRSDGSIAVNQIAVAYQGGGHPAAAGATIPGNLDTIMAEVVGKVNALLASEG